MIITMSDVTCLLPTNEAPLHPLLWARNWAKMKRNMLPFSNPGSEAAKPLKNLANLIMILCCHNRCEWNGQECFASNFTTRITDYGLCYIFNDKEGTLTDKTGNTIPFRSTRTGIARFIFHLFTVFGKFNHNVRL